MNSRFRFGTTLGAALAVATAAPTASADDSAAAQALFDQAKKALAAHDYSEACPKLEESYKLQEALGTLLNLADCYERAGKLASAWSKFLEVATKARANGQAQRARIGRDRAAALAPKLSNLVVEVPPTSRVQALEIRRDGTGVGEAEWGAVIPADAGAHVIEASAPGRKPWSQTVAVSTGATTARTSVPELTLLPPPPETKHAPEVAVSDAPKTAATADSGSSPGGGQRVAGLPQLLLQRRQRLRRLRLRRLLGKEVELAGGPEPALALDDVGQLLCHLQQPLGGGDLPAQGSLLDCRHHYIAAQGQIGGLELEAIALLLRLGNLHLAPDQAEDIRGIGQGQLGRVQRVGGAARHRRAGQGAGRKLRTIATEAALHRGEEAGLLRQVQFVSLAQSRLRGAHIGVGLQRLPYQLVELGRLKQRPPLSRNIHCGDEVLGVAGGALGRGGLALRGRAAVVGGRGRGRALEVRSYRARRQQRDERAESDPRVHYKPHRTWPWRCSAQCSIT